MANETPSLPNPIGDVLPPAPDYHRILDAIAVALSSLPGADGMMMLRAEAALTKQNSKGHKYGYECGIRDGYQRGYSEGLQDGQREALDKAAHEEAESATLKAAARSRRRA